MSKGDFYKPGQKAPESGQYPVVGPRGGQKGYEVTAVEGKRLPPLPEPGLQYGSPDVTQHKNP